MATVILDPQGRLVQFTAVPLQVDDSQPAAVNPDPAPLFRAADLDFETFRPVPPQWTPLAADDYRAAWTGAFRGHPEDPIRVEAAWWRGKPVYFEIVGPWTRAGRMPRNTPSVSPDRYVSIALSFLVVFGGALMAWRNLRLGRGDRSGALHLAGFAFVVGLAAALLAVHNLFSSWGWTLFSLSAGAALWQSLMLWMAYMALEPAVRHRWPRVLISWTRLLSGRWRDPVVARDALVGVLVGLAWALVFAAVNEASIRTNALPVTGTEMNQLLGLPFIAAIVANHVVTAVVTGLILFFFFFVLRTILRREWLAGIAFVLVFVLSKGLTDSNPILASIAYAAIFSMIVPMMLRFGLVSFVISVFVVNLLQSLPFTLHFSAWYGTGSLVFVLVIAGLTLVACRNALGAKALLGPLFEE